MLHHIIDDYRIAAAYLNSFGARVLSDKNGYKDIANRMKLRSELNIELEKYIKNKKYTFIKSKFKQVDVIDTDDFPKYDLETIRKNITFGSYQIKMSFSYIYSLKTKKQELPIFINKQ